MCRNGFADFNLLVILAFFFSSNSRLYGLNVMKQVFPREWLFLGVCSHTLGIGDAVVMGNAVVLWLLSGYPSHTVASKFVVSEPLLRKCKFALLPWVRSLQV